MGFQSPLINGDDIAGCNNPEQKTVAGEQFLKHHHEKVVGPYKPVINQAVLQVNSEGSREGER